MIETIEIAGPAAAPSAGSPNSATNGAAKERSRTPAEVAEAPRAEAGPLQRTCLAVLRGDWTTLALVAMDPAAPGQPFATALAEVARAYRLRPIRVVDGAAASPAQVTQLQDELSSKRGGEGRTVIALDDPRRSPGGAPLLVHADAVVLVVRLGATELRAIEETVDIVGRGRVLGCVLAR